tara:strand:- start:730 stop:1017 length:288 start_codon:yes stop_codon:yes gene_type:complete
MVAMFAFAVPAFAVSDTALQVSGDISIGMKYIAASLAFGIAAIAAGLAVGKAGAAGLAAVVENPELKSQSLIIIAIAEAIAIYGIVIALLILGAE